MERREMTQPYIDKMMKACGATKIISPKFTSSLSFDHSMVKEKYPDLNITLETENAMGKPLLMNWHIEGPKDQVEAFIKEYEAK